MIERCDQLNLHLVPGAMAPDLAVAAYTTALVMNYRFTGKLKRTQ